MFVIGLTSLQNVGFVTGMFNCLLNHKLYLKWTPQLAVILIVPVKNVPNINDL